MPRCTDRDTSPPVVNRRSNLTPYRRAAGVSQHVRMHGEAELGDLPIEPPVGRQIVGSGPHLTFATTEPILVQTREEPLLEALVLPSFPCPVRF
jgi:hypothetical protein